MRKDAPFLFPGGARRARQGELQMMELGVRLGLALAVGACVAALWVAARHRRDRPLYLVSAAALLAGMAFVLAAACGGGEPAAVAFVLLFGGVLAVVHGWFVATLALSGEPDATSRARFLFALGFGTALGLFYPATQPLLAARLATAEGPFVLSHTNFYPWGCLGYFLYGMAALLLFRTLGRRARCAARLPPSVAVAAAWLFLGGWQFLLDGCQRAGIVTPEVCRWLPFNLAGLDVCAPYHVAVAALLLSLLALIFVKRPTASAPEPLH